MTGQTHAKLLMYFLEVILITIPMSLVLLIGYRRAVARSMRQVGDTTVPVPAAKAEGLDDKLAFVQHAFPAYHQPVKATHRRLALVYALGGLVGAGIMAFLFALSMQFDLSPLGGFVGWYVYAWPIIPITVILLALPQNRNLVLLLLYLLLGGVVVIGWSWVSSSILGRVDVSPVKNTRFFSEFLLRQSWLPFLIILVTGSRRLRQVSPLVLAALFTLGFGSLFSRELYTAAVQANPNNPWLIFAGGSHTYSLWYFIAAVPLGYLCWLGIQRLASWYERKRFSDVQLTVDSWWLVATVQFSTELSSDFGWGGLAGLLAFIGYRGSVEVGLRSARLPSDRRGPTLLLLRVFGFQRRTEALFDSVAERWRFVGPVMMIAGADLAMRTLNPGDVVSFVSGKLQSRFIAGEAQVRQAPAAIDGTRDPDGRFRTTKFFCRDDTWRPTLMALLGRSDVVLMDLRGFTESNRGCLFELQAIISRELLPRTLFVVDRTTNVSLLEETVGQQALASGKPGLQSLRVSHVTRQSGAELARVYGSLEGLVAS